MREIKSAALRYHAFDGDNSCGEIIQNGQADEGLVDEELKIDLGQLNKVVETMVIESPAGERNFQNDVAKALGISRQALYKNSIEKNDVNRCKEVDVCAASLFSLPLKTMKLQGL